MKSGAPPGSPPAAMKQVEKAKYLYIWFYRKALDDAKKAIAPLLKGPLSPKD